MFFKGSRYQKVPTLEITDEKGRVIRHKGIRWITTPRAFDLHRVDQDERLDHISHRHYQDAERFWLICDANLAMWPNDMVKKPGKRIAIPPPED